MHNWDTYAGGLLFLDIGDVNGDGLPDILVGANYGYYQDYDGDGFDEIAFRLYMNEHTPGNGLSFYSL